MKSLQPLGARRRRGIVIDRCDTVVVRALPHPRNALARRVVTVRVYPQVCGARTEQERKRDWGVGCEKRDKDGRDASNCGREAWVTNMESDARLSGWSFTFRITKGGAVVKKFIDPAGATFHSLISALASLARRVPRSASTAPSPTAAAASVIAAAAPAAARHAGFAPSTSVLVDFNDQKWPATVLRCDARNESVDVRYWPTKGYAESAFESGVAMSRVELARVAEAVGARARVVKRAPPAAASPKLPSRPLERARKKARAAATSTPVQRPLGRPRKRPTMGTVTPRKSTYRGVSWCTLSRKWRADLQHAGERHYLGAWICELDAARAYDCSAREFVPKRQARFNFPCSIAQPSRTQARRAPVPLARIAARGFATAHSATAHSALDEDSEVPEGAKAARQDTRLARVELPVGLSSARVRNSFVGRWCSLGEREASSALFFDRVRASAEHVRALVERETPPLVEPPPPRDAAAHPAGLAAVAATVASLVVAVVD